MQFTFLHSYQILRGGEISEGGYPGVLLPSVLDPGLGTCYWVQFRKYGQGSFILACSSSLCRGVLHFSAVHFYSIWSKLRVFYTATYLFPQLRWESWFNAVELNASECLFLETEERKKKLGNVSVLPGSSSSSEFKILTLIITHYTLTLQFMHKAGGTPASN